MIDVWDPGPVVCVHVTIHKRSRERLIEVAATLVPIVSNPPLFMEGAVRTRRRAVGAAEMT